MNDDRFGLWRNWLPGATMAGWGVTLAFIVWYPFTKREPWSWNAIAIGLALWFVIDTLISVYTKAYFNVGVNVLLIVLAGIPLIMSYRAFTRRVID